MKQKLIGYFKIFILLNFLFLILVSINLIPKSAIEKNIINSLDVFKENSYRYNVFNNIDASKDDIIADSVILNMNYQNYNNPLKDTLLSKFYYKEKSTYIDNFIISVEENLEKNQEYSRYWHGYNILYRPLLTIMNIIQIKIFYLFIFIILVGILFYYCNKNNMKEFAYIFIIGCALSNYLMSAISLEYIPAFLLSVISCILIIKYKGNNYLLLFSLFGMLTCFFDFLTIETVTLTLPLICIIIKFYKNNEKIKVTNFIFYCSSWLATYLLSFLYKWVLTACITGENYISSSFNAGITRAQSSTINELAGIKLNILMLFPNLNRAKTAMIIFFIIILILLIILFLFRKDNINKNNIFVSLLLTTFIPYIRYILLFRHAYEHYFFTYRAQISSIICVLLIFYYFIDLSMLRRKK